MNRVQRVLIGDGVNTTSAAAGTHLTVASIAAGDLLVVDKGMKVLSETTAVAASGDTDIIYIAMGLGGGKFRLSSPIQAGQVSSFKGKIWEKAANQVTYIGYNGTDGDISAANSTQYILRVIFKDEQRLIANRQTAITVNYTSDASATKQEIVKYLIKRINTGQYKDLVKAERVAAGTLTELGADTTVVKGNTTVTSASHGLVQGDLVSLQDVAYEVASATTNAFVLDQAYTGESETIAVASTVNKAAKLTTVTAWGIKLTGKDIPTSYPDKYETVAFSVALVAGFDPASVAVRTATKAFAGAGLPVQLKELEFIAQGWLGQSNRIQWPIPTSISYVDTSLAGYDVISIEHFDDHIGDLQGRMRSPISTIIAIPANVSGTTRSAQANTSQGGVSNTGTDATLAILNAWIVKYGKVTSTVSL